MDNKVHPLDWPALVNSEQEEDFKAWYIFCSTFGRCIILW